MPASYQPSVFWILTNGYLETVRWRERDVQAERIREMWRKKEDGERDVLPDCGKMGAGTDGGIDGTDGEARVSR